MTFTSLAALLACSPDGSHTPVSGGLTAPLPVTSYTADCHLTGVDILALDAAGTPAAVVSARYAYTYDDADRLLTWNYTDPDGFVLQGLSYYYDASGMLIATETVLSGYVIESDVYFYDELGLLVKLDIDYTGDTLPDRRYVYTNGPDGNRLAEDYYSWVDGPLSARRTYEYDVNAMLISAQYDEFGDGTVESEDKYSYDSSGNMTERALFDSYGTLSSSYSYAYDASGNALSEEQKLPSGYVQLGHYCTFDVHSNLLSFETTQWGTCFQLRYAYDVNANITSAVYDRKCYYEQFDMFYEYIYDSGVSELTNRCVSGAFLLSCEPPPVVP